MANPSSMITPSVTANTSAPSPRAVEVAAAIGTDAAVAARKMSRTDRALPDTALAAQASCCHGSQSSPNSKATSPTPVQVGS